MGLRVFPTVFNHSGVRFALSAAVVVLLTATTSQAGFEWVPSEPKAAPAPVVETVPMAPPVLEPLMPSDKALSPMTMDKPAPVIRQATPLLPQEPQPVAKPVMKVHSMKPVQRDMKKESLTTPPAPRKIIAVPAQEPVKMPEPVVTNTRVVMPVDAPVTARQNMPKAEVLKINPFPDDLTKVESQAQMDAQSESVAAIPSNEVVGFGNDMPLALALQQIAPSGYAFSFGESVNPGSKVSWSGGKGWFDVMQDMIAPLNLKASVRNQSIFISHEQHSSVAPQQSAIIEPASGNAPAQSIEQPVRRNAIQDPGLEPQAQPLGTLDIIESNASEITAHPKNGAHIWEANKGDGLKQTLANWSQQGQFDIEWRVAHDFALESDVLVAGQIESAVQTLIKTGLSNDKAPSFTFVKSPDTPSKGRLIIGDLSSASAS